MFRSVFLVGTATDLLITDHGMTLNRTAPCRRDSGGSSPQRVKVDTYYQICSTRYIVVVP